MIKQVLIFVVGVAAGAAASYFITKDKLNKEYEESLNLIRASYDERVEKIHNSAEAIKLPHEKKDAIMQEIEKQVEEQKLDSEKKTVTETDYSSISAIKKEKKKSETKDPIHIITEQEAQSKANSGFEIVGLTLYEDDVLVDDDTENIIEDYEPWIGVGGLNNIRNNESEAIYILNEDRKAIYDITVIDERFGDGYDPRDF